MVIEENTPQNENYLVKYELVIPYDENYVNNKYISETDFCYNLKNIHLFNIYIIKYYNKNTFMLFTMWRSCELFLHSDISQVHRTSEISLPKTMNMIFPCVIATNLLLFSCHTIIDLIFILMIYVYDWKSLLVKQQYHSNVI